MERGSRRDRHTASSLTRRSRAVCLLSTAYAPGRCISLDQRRWRAWLRLPPVTQLPIPRTKPTPDGPPSDGSGEHALHRGDSPQQRTRRSWRDSGPHLTTSHNRRMFQFGIRPAPLPSVVLLRKAHVRSSRDWPHACRDRVPTERRQHYHHVSNTPIHSTFHPGPPCPHLDRNNTRAGPRESIRWPTKGWTAGQERTREADIRRGRCCTLRTAGWRVDDTEVLSTNYTCMTGREHW